MLRVQTVSVRGSATSETQLSQEHRTEIDTGCQSTCKNTQIASDLSAANKAKPKNAFGDHDFKWVKSVAIGQSGLRSMHKSDNPPCRRAKINM